MVRFYSSEHAEICGKSWPAPVTKKGENDSREGSIIVNSPPYAHCSAALHIQFNAALIPAGSAIWFQNYTKLC